MQMALGLTFKTAILTSAATIALCIAPARAQQQSEKPSTSAEQTKSFSVPAQAAGDAIPLFARQAGIQVLASGEIIRGKHTNAVEGSYTADAGLSLLLAGTGLTAEKNAGGSGIVTIRSRGNRKSDQGAWLNGGVEQLPIQTAQAVESRPAAGIEEVIVTARRREERLQDVPMSIAVVTAKDIAARGLVSSADYLRGIPGANQVEGGYGQSIVVRGIETSPHLQNLFSGTTTATYFGETPTTSAAGLGGGSSIDVKLVDVARVEVLRGPQGTSYGASALGGAVRVIPNSPDATNLEAKASMGYSVTARAGSENHSFDFIGNLPVVEDKLAMRGVAYRYLDSGYYRNVAAGDAAFKVAVAPYGAAQFAVNDAGIGRSEVEGARLSALLLPTDTLRLTLGYLVQAADLDSIPVATDASYRQSVLQVAPQHRVRGETGGVYDTDIEIANIVAEYDLGWADLLGSYSHTTSGSISAYPFSALALPFPASAVQDSDHKEKVGEIRIASKFSGSLNFTAGLYLESIDDLSFLNNFWSGTPSTNIFGADLDFGTSNDRRTLEQRAAFTEVTWAFADQLLITGGVRAYDYERRAIRDTVGSALGTTHTDSKLDSSGQNFRANVSYRVTDDFNVFGGWSQGFRLGQPQAGLPAGICDISPADGIIDFTNISIASTREVDSDTIDSYEVGAKYGDHRLRVDATAFRMDWNNVPVQVRFDRTPCVAGYTANVGKARSKGLELQTVLKASDAISLTVGAAYNDAAFITNAPGIGVQAGDRLPGTSKFTANAGIEIETVAGSLPLIFRLDSIYIGSSYGEPTQDARTRSDDYVKLDAAVRMILSDVTLNFYAKNLTNSDAVTFRGNRVGIGPNYGYQLRPRTIGVQAAVTF